MQADPPKTPSRMRITEVVECMGMLSGCPQLAAANASCSPYNVLQFRPGSIHQNQRAKRLVECHWLQTYSCKAEVMVQTLTDLKIVA